MPHCIGWREKREERREKRARPEAPASSSTARGRDEMGAWDLFSLLSSLFSQRLNFRHPHSATSIPTTAATVTSLKKCAWASTRVMAQPAASANQTTDARG